MKWNPKGFDSCSSHFLPCVCSCTCWLVIHNNYPGKYVQFIYNIKNIFFKNKKSYKAHDNTITLFRQGIFISDSHKHKIWKHYMQTTLLLCWVQFYILWPLEIHIFSVQWINLWTTIWENCNAAASLTSGSTTYGGNVFLIVELR